MRRLLISLVLATCIITLAGSFGFAQGGASSTLSGVVVDSSGGVIPGAEVTVKNDATAAEFKTITADNGTFSIPSLSPGTYTATIAAPSFKQAVVTDVKLTAGIPSNIRVALQVGGTNETVVVQAGAEVVQSQTATISTTLMVSQISNLPLVTRNAMDFLTMLPGVNTTGGARGSTVAGLPQSTINITIDGINTQDNYNKSSDGFFSYISPRIDAVEEVTVSTATPGAESAGQGAVQIRFVTRSGNNEYHGSLYEYHKNPSLNSNYWFNNRNYTAPAGQDPNTWKAPRDRVLLNQPGGRIGGISLPKKLFGPLGFDGKDKAFFFVNYEEFRLPAQQTRTDTLYVPEVLSTGNFLYTVGSETRRVNLLDLAAANGQTSTWDPTMKRLLQDMQDSTQYGSVQPQADPLFQYLYFSNSGVGIRKYLTTRFDFNLTSKHRLEGSWNYSQYVFGIDFLNGVDPQFPKAPNYGTQGGNRFSTSMALRSTLTPRLVNEARVGFNGGTTIWYPEQTGPDQFANMDYYYYAFPGNNTNYYRVAYSQRRSTPVETIDDNLTWTKGSHSFTFGYNWTNVGSWFYNKYAVPGLTVNLDTTYDPARTMFDSVNAPKNLPGASNSQLTQARALYATMTGRVTAISGTAWLDENSLTYQFQGAQVQRFHMREMALFLSDSWRARPGLTMNYGVRWELQLPLVPLSDIFSYATVDDAWGRSGTGSLFTPGASGGQTSQVQHFEKGSPAYNTDYKSVAPSFGFAWTPGQKQGFLGRILGNGGQTVLRGGFSVAYNRYGMGTYVGMITGNIGPSLTASRTTTIGNFPAEGSWPVLFRDKNRLVAGDFPDSPTYPLTPGISDSVRTIDPDIRTPYTMSWSFGIQREITKDTALEIRYVANRNLQGWDNRNLNGERTYIENGFLDEFKLAISNLQANIAANRGNNFKYYGPGTGTSPLPITLAYFSGVTATDATNPAKYTSSNFTSSTYVNTLATTNPNPSTYASSLYGNATQRNNAIAAGLAPNFFVVNPQVSNAYIYVNGGYNYYDSLVVELRRRLAKGLLVQGNYVFSKGLSSSRQSFRAPYFKVVNSNLPHAFKVNWLYELPIGRNKAFLGDMNGWLDRVVGNWEFQGVGRLQSGNWLDYGNVRLVGMSLQDLKDASGLRFYDADKRIYYVDESIRTNTIAAYNTSATTSTGYSTSFGVPSGRYIAPASTMDCIQIYSGQCSPLTNMVHGPGFTRFDLSLVKKIRFTEQSNFEFRAEFLNAFNNINFYGNTCAGTSQTCGEVTSAYQDRNQTQDPGGRTIQFVARINF